MQNACAVLSSDPSGSTIFFPHYLINGTIFEEEEKKKKRY